MPYPVNDIANYIIRLVNSDAEFGENITNLRLQKLMYYAHRFSLAWYGAPLVNEPFVAWAHGPVIRSLYNQYKAYGADPIPDPEGFESTVIDNETQELVEEMFGVYGQYSAWGLRNLTHQEIPWIETPQNQNIPNELIECYFREQLSVA